MNPHEQWLRATPAMLDAMRAASTAAGVGGFDFGLLLRVRFETKVPP